MLGDKVVKMGNDPATWLLIFFFSKNFICKIIKFFYIKTDPFGICKPLCVALDHINIIFYLDHRNLMQSI